MNDHTLSVNQSLRFEQVEQMTEHVVLDHLNAMLDRRLADESMTDIGPRLLRKEVQAEWSDRGPNRTMVRVPVAYLFILETTARHAV